MAETSAVATKESFNPLAGIRCFLTARPPGQRPGVQMGFNPLAGIRCFLTTLYRVTDSVDSWYRFQSPSGDSLFSDVTQLFSVHLSEFKFQSPSGDSLFSDALDCCRSVVAVDWFQSPSGDSLFSDAKVTLEFENQDEIAFQSPSGDSLFSDEAAAAIQFRNTPRVSIP